MTERAQTYVHPAPGITDFVNASAGELERLYDAIFRRMERAEPALRCFANGSPDRKRVMDRVAELADRYPEVRERPPLFGVPVGVKDVFRMDDEPIQCGSLLPPDVFRGREAACVTALKRAGAIVLGRTCTAEFAYFEPGPTANPYDTGRTPGGSSSGSACGVAAGLFPLALGTQTIGSIVRPASYCGVVGFKPTLGRIAPDGLVMFSPTMDQAGLFCSSPRDLDSVMAAAFGPWHTAPQPRRINLGLPVGPYLDQVPDEQLASFKTRLTALAAEGRKNGLEITLMEIPCLEDIAEITALHGDLIAGEAAREHMDHGWFERFQHLYRPRSAALVRDGLRVSAERMDAARGSASDLRSRLVRLMDEHAVDAWAAPSTLAEAPLGLDSTGSPAMNLPWTHAGLPVLSLPLGIGPTGLPLGLQLIAKPGVDEHLVAMAAALADLG